MVKHSHATQSPTNHTSLLGNCERANARANDSPLNKNPERPSDTNKFKSVNLGMTKTRKDKLTGSIANGTATTASAAHTKGACATLADNLCPSHHEDNCSAKTKTHCHSPFAIRYLPFAICHSLSAIRHLPFAICHSPSAIRYLPFAICHSLSAIRYLPREAATQVPDIWAIVFSVCHKINTSSQKDRFLM
jgi:hypothetical protein